MNSLDCGSVMENLGQIFRLMMNPHARNQIVEFSIDELKLISLCFKGYKLHGFQDYSFPADIWSLGTFVCNTHAYLLHGLVLHLATKEVHVKRNLIRS